MRASSSLKMVIVVATFNQKHEGIKKRTDYVRLWAEARHLLGPEERDGAAVLHNGTDLSRAWVDSCFLV